MSKTSQPIDWDAFRELIDSHHRILLTSHVRPDCDSLGSQLAMADLLEALGKQVALVNSDPVPENLLFIDPDNRIQQFAVDVPNDELPDVDLIIVMDTSVYVQLGPIGDQFKATDLPIAVLDHHVSDNDVAQHVYKETDADSTGRLVHDAFEAYGVPIAESTAYGLMAAIATDTGWYRFNSTSARTMYAIAHLIEAGARPEKLYQQLYEQRSLARLKLVGRIYDQLQSECNGQLLYSVVTLKDLKETGASPTDTDGVINSFHTVALSEVALLFMQLEKEKFKVSLRSRSMIDCNAIANTLGGGGHKNASGVTLTGDQASCMEQLLPLFRTAIKETNGE